MKLKHRYHILAGAMLFFLATHIAQADDEVPCYDYSKVTAPIEVSFGPNPTAQGARQRGQWAVEWAAAQTQINRPISELISLLLNHDVTKSGSVDEYEVEKPTTNSVHQEQHLVHFLIKPFPFVRVRWTEHWVYDLLQGTKEQPAKFHAAYQKVKGTSHIEHLCGSVLLEKLNPTQTKVTYLEEARATNQTVENTLKGVLGTIESLKISPVKPVK